MSLQGCHGQHQAALPALSPASSTSHCIAASADTGAAWAGALFRNAGLQPDTKVMASSSKVLSFIKPTV